MLGAAFVLVGSVLLSAPAPSQTTQMTMPNARDALAFLHVTRGDRAALINRSDVLRETSSFLRVKTDLGVEPVDPKSVLDCRGKLSCTIARVRTDYNRSVYVDPVGESVRPYRDHVKELEERKVRYARYLMLVSSTNDEGEERMTVVMIDTDRALELFHHADRRDREGWEARVESEILARAAIGPPASASIENAGALKEFIETYFERSVRRELERSGHWEPFGSVLISGIPDRQTLSVDGNSIGAVGPGVLVLAEVKAGTHEIGFNSDAYGGTSVRVTVRANEQSIAQPIFQEAPSAAHGTIRTAALWGGLAVAVVGASLTTWAIVQSSRGVETFCITADIEADCGSSRWVRAGYGPGQAPTFEDINGGSVLLAPLGYSLAIMGGTWSLGALLSDADAIPWVPLIAGFVGGVAAYGISAALDGTDPYTP